MMRGSFRTPAGVLGAIGGLGRFAGAAADRRASPAPARALLAAVLLLLLPAGAAAQHPHLEAAETRLAAGEYDEARTLVERWWREHGDAADVRARPLALLLRARLTSDLAAAERDYLAIVLGHPTSEHAPEALLRLGQGLLAAGEPERAAAYLERLLADYPAAGQRWTGTLWLARARAAQGRAASACQAFQLARSTAANADALAVVQAEEAQVCAGEARAAADARPPAAPAQPARAAAQERAAPEAGAAATGRFTVQLGAFREADRADRLAASLRRQGHEARVVRVAGSGLVRVRVGRFASAGAADAVRARLAAAGFEAVVVGDANQERPR